MGQNDDVHIFNGIPDFYSSRSDLVDRSIGITLKRIDSANRRSSKEIEAIFESKRGAILGVLLDLLVSIIRYLPHVKLTSKPRMADFAEFVSAAEPRLGWSAGTAVELLDRNRREAEGMVLENCVYADIIKNLVPYKGGEWKKSATALLQEIEQKIGDDPRKRRQVPQSPGHLSGSLRRYIPAFASIGIEIDCDGKTSGANSKRTIMIKRTHYPNLSRKYHRISVQGEFDPVDLSKPPTAEVGESHSKGCFGDPNIFEPMCDTCLACEFEHECRDQVNAVLNSQIGEANEVIS